MSAAVYRMYDADERLLYVGCSVQWPIRLGQHQDKPWWQHVARVDLEHFADWREALKAEGEAQAIEQPAHNVVRNGRIPNLKARRAELRDARETARAQRDDELRFKGVYETWRGCSNCRRHGRVQIPLGTPKDEHPCPECGVSPCNLQSAAA